MSYIEIRYIILNSLYEAGNVGRAYKRHAQSYLKSKGFNKENIDKIINELPPMLGVHRKESPKYKFLLGMCRWMATNQLTKDDDYIKARTIIKYAGSDGHIDEYDEDLNGGDIIDLYELYKPMESSDAEISRNEVYSKEYHNSSDYDIVKIEYPQDAEEYAPYTSWCITQGSFHDYGLGILNQAYFCLKPGFKKYKAYNKNKPYDICNEETAPFDEYGLSMISVIVDHNGEPLHITTRYNHLFGGEDNPKLSTAKQVSDFLDVNFYETFKPNTKFKDFLKKLDDTLKEGKLPKNEILDFNDTTYDEDYEDDYDEDKVIEVVSLKRITSSALPVIITYSESLSNIITQDYKLLFDDWADNISIWHRNKKDYIVVEYIRNKILYDIDLNEIETGLPSDIKIERIANDDYMFVINKDNKHSIIDNDFNLLYPDKWFDNISYFETNETFIIVTENKKHNIFNLKTGKTITDDWYEKIININNYFFIIKKSDKKYNIIDAEGNPFFDTDKIFISNNVNDIIANNDDGTVSLYRINKNHIKHISDCYNFSLCGTNYIVTNKDGQKNIFNPNTEKYESEWCDDIEYEHIYNEYILKKDGLIKTQRYNKISPVWHKEQKKQNDLDIYIKDDKFYICHTDTNEPIIDEWIDGYEFNYVPFDDYRNSTPSIIILINNDKKNIYNITDKFMVLDVWVDDIKYKTVSDVYYDKKQKAYIKYGKYTKIADKDKINYVNVVTGELSLREWVIEDDYIDISDDGTVRKGIDKKTLLGTKNKESYDYISSYYYLDGNACEVKNGNEYNIMNRDGDLLFKKWGVQVNKINRYAVALIYNDGTYDIIDINGKLFKHKCKPLTKSYNRRGFVVFDITRNTSFPKSCGYDSIYFIITRNDDKEALYKIDASGIKQITEWSEYIVYIDSIDDIIIYYKRITGKGVAVFDSNGKQYTDFFDNIYRDKAKEKISTSSDSYVFNCYDQNDNESVITIDF